MSNKTFFELDQRNMCLSSAAQADILARTTRVAPRLQTKLAEQSNTDPAIEVKEYIEVTGPSEQLERGGTASFLVECVQAIATRGDRVVDSDRDSTGLQIALKCLGTNGNKMQVLGLAHEQLLPQALR